MTDSQCPHCGTPDSSTMAHAHDSCPKAPKGPCTHHVAPLEEPTDRLDARTLDEIGRVLGEHWPLWGEDVNGVICPMKCSCGEILLYSNGSDWVEHIQPFLSIYFVPCAEHGAELEKYDTAYARRLRQLQEEHEAAIAAVVEKARDAIHKRVSEVYGGREAKGFRHAFWRDCLNPVFDSLAPQSAQDALQEAKAAARKDGIETLTGMIRAHFPDFDPASVHLMFDALREAKAEAVSRLALVLDARIAELRDSVLDLQDLRQAMDKVKEEAR